MYLDTAFEAIRRRSKTFGRSLARGLDLDERTDLALLDRYVTDA